MNPRRSLLAAAGLAASLLALVPRAGEAQDDVELLGRIYGTTPPAAYYQRKAADPSAFTFGRAWKSRNPAVQATSAGQVTGEPPRYRFLESGVRVGAEATRRGEPGPQRVLGPPSGVVEGTFHFPLLLTHFADTPLPAYSQAVVQQEFFDGPNSRYKTIPEFYDELSGGRVDLRGETFPWYQSTLTRSEAAGSTSGLGGDARIGELIVEALSDLDDGSVDWGRYDNDGPDGVPNSGDDDGFVDILAIMHSEWGAECTGGAEGGLRIWSHKWRLGPGGAMGQTWATSTPAAGGGFIRVDDYAIQPVQACQGGSINHIGVLAHELGHGFGLPDLYGTGSAQHAGIGEWGLMGSGAWGCRGTAPERPCSMNAWSRAILGWVEVVTLAPGEDHGDLSIEPVETSGRVYRVDAADGSGEYFLLENRQPIGFDQDLHAPGLLVWHIDPVWTAGRWASNTVNSTASHMGVWLRQADDLNELALGGGGRGDAGDPYPGSTGNTAFHVGSFPSARTFGGAPSGLTLVDVQEAGGNDVVLRALTRFQTVSVAMEGPPEDGVLLVDGNAVPSGGHSFQSAPFQKHVIAAQGGQSMEDGRRRGFQWSDAPGAPRERQWVTGLDDADLVARFGDIETRLRLTVTGGVFGVAPGVVTPTPIAALEPDGWWFEEGTSVALHAEPNTGFDFTRWSGDLEGLPNPATIVMDTPRDIGVEFGLTYAVASGSYAALVAGRAQELMLVAENGVAPIEWRLEGGSLPEGVTLRSDGRVVGTPLEDGSFLVQVWARDARGLEDGAALVIEVVPPPFDSADLVRPLLGHGSTLTESEETYLDASGNRNDMYDLGDFRAFVVGHPGFPQASSPAPSGARVEQVEVVRFPGEGER